MNFDVVNFVSNQVELFRGALSDQSITWEKEKQFAIQAFQKSEYLEKVARSNPSSAQNAIINVAAIGITLNPASKLAYLVPRDGQVCLDLSYMGLLHLATQSGSIRWGQCVVVHANDNFKLVGIDKAPVHEYNCFATPEERGEPVGAYCVVKTMDGDFLTDTMGKADILSIRDRSSAWKAWVSKQKKCPWVTDELEMWRKTVVKRAYKYWPKVERLDRAIDYLNNTSGEGLEELHNSYREKIIESQAIEFYPGDKFELNMPKWQDLIQSGKKTAAAVIATVESRQPMTDAQKQTINAIKAQ